MFGCLFVCLFCLFVCLLSGSLMKKITGGFFMKLSELRGNEHTQYLDQ